VHVSCKSTNKLHMLSANYKISVYFELLNKVDMKKNSCNMNSCSIRKFKYGIPVAKILSDPESVDSRFTISRSA